MRKSASGFTIVELLIVIVVIAILAAIGIVAYNGIQTRAHNIQQISAAKAYLTGITSYTIANGKHPTSINRVCIMLAQADCVNNTSWNRDSAFENSLKTIMGNLPKPNPSIPVVSGPKMGYVPISGNTANNLKLDGVDTAFLIYAVEFPGTCTAGTPVSGTWPTFTSAVPAQGYTYIGSDGATRMCFIPLPNPN